MKHTGYRDSKPRGGMAMGLPWSCVHKLHSGWVQKTCWESCTMCEGTSSNSKKTKLKDVYFGTKEF